MKGCGKMILVNGIEVEFKTFPNGERNFNGSKLLSKIFNESEEAFKNKDNAFSPSSDQPINLTFKYEDDSSLIELYFVKKYLELFLEKVNLIILYMPYSRMDRVEINNPLTLKYVAEFINSMSFNSVIVIEPHSDVTGALLNKVSTYNITTEILLPKAIAKTGFDKDLDYVIFPDAGASKRYSKDVDVKKIAYGDKSRDFTTGEISKLNLINFDPMGVNNVIILDDLISYGGTYVKTIERLVELGYKGHIYIVAAHCENAIFMGDLLKGKVPVDKIFTTNSMVSETNHLYKMCINSDKLEITKLGGIE